jgi:Family of unknown function (DUF6084)
MPDLDFHVLRVEPAARGLTPLLHFTLAVRNTPADEPIKSVLLQTQIQIQSPRRSYNAREKEKLVELFGTPEQWGQTLRNRLWTHAVTNVHAFTGATEALVPVPCTFDLNVSATKYFYALDGGEIPLLFLFSGTVFYSASDGRLQTQQISWGKECEWRMPVNVWREMMEHHYPQTAWLRLPRDVFDKLYAYKREHGMTSWEQVIERLLCNEHVASEQLAKPQTYPHR